jgi:uncharacterized protein (TIGR00304 family)
MTDLASLGFLVVLVGVAVILYASFLSAKQGGQTQVKGGGVVMIGPVPIVFGSDAKWTTAAVVLAIVLVLLGLLYYVI